MNDDMTASISLQEWLDLLDLKSKCAALTLERDATHMAWKADVEACEAEVKRWQSGCEKEYTRAQVLTAEVEALQRERDSAVTFIRVCCEELVMAGFPRGDRVVVLKNVRALIAERDSLKAQIAEREKERDALKAAYRSEHAIVDSVWRVLGITTYEQAGGKTVYGLVAELLTRAERAEAQAAECAKLIRDCQSDLAEYIVPNSGVSDATIVNRLLERLDGSQARAALAAPGERG